MIDLSSLSAKLKTSKMNVINHYKRIVKKNKNWVNHTKMISRKRFFDDKLASIIVRSFDLSSAKGSSIFNKDVLLSKLKDQKALIDNLRSETSAKDNQIHRLDNLLDQQQQLSLADKKDKNELKKQIKALKLPQKSDPKPDSKDHSNNGAKAIQHGFIWHLFH